MAELTFTWKLISMAEDHDELLLEFVQIRWFKSVGDSEIECPEDDPDAHGVAVDGCTMLIKGSLELVEAGFRIGQTYRSTFP